MLRVTNPFDQQTLCELPHDDGEALDRKVAAARTAFATWRGVPLAERAELVRAGVERFRAGAESIARDVSLQMGKPIEQARNEVNTLLDRAGHMLAIAPDALGPEVLPEKPGFHRRIEHVPLGVVLDLAAWNYPLIIPVNVVVPALVAGNTVLLKHSARTPLTGKAFEDAFAGLGVEGLVTNLVLTHETTARLLADPRVAHVAFTGSVAGGRAVARRAAEREGAEAFIDVGLELGGNDPAYVAEDADLDFAVANVVDGACYNAGQSCCAVERVYVHRRRHDEFLERACALLDAYRLGDPLDEATTMGPLARRGALDELEGQVGDAVSRGARLLRGGRRVAGVRGNFFEPTLLDGAPKDAVVMQEESFGPLVPVRAVEGDEEALRLMDDTRYGLTASIWTRDRERAERLAAALEAGTIYQNRCDYLDPALPWTGFRESGRGTTLSRYGYLALTRRRGIHFRAETRGAV